MTIKKITALRVAMILPLLFSCNDDDQDVQYHDFKATRGGPSNVSSEAAKRRAAKKAADKNKDKEHDPNSLALPQLSETTFISGPTRRDPFLPFLEVLIKRDRIIEVVERDVKLKNYDISELKLVGIITNIGDPRAMVTTPDRTGFVIRRGDYVGRADFVKQGSQGEQIQVNWRVSRIHGTGKKEERGVYLVRDDPTTTRGVDVTRFVPLHPPD